MCNGRAVWETTSSRGACTRCVLAGTVRAYLPGEERRLNIQLKFQCHPVFISAVSISSRRLNNRNLSPACQWETRSTAPRQQNLTRSTALKAWTIACDVQGFQIQEALWGLAWNEPNPKGKGGEKR